MKLERPESGRSTLTETPEGIYVRIAGQRSLFGAGFLAFWLCGWAVGEVMVTGVLLSWLFGQSNPDSTFAVFFMLVWLGGWTIGGVAAIASFLWLAFGREEIVAIPVAISISNNFGLFKRTRHFGLKDIQNLRVDTSPAASGTSKRQGLMGTPKDGAGCTIKFDFGRQTKGFGAALDRLEATEIVAALHNRYPQLNSAAENTQA